jgi:transposase
MNCFIFGKRGVVKMKRLRRRRSPECKAKVAFQAIRSDKTLADLAQQHKIHSYQITTWKQQLLG